jgi:6-phosphogluconolactonase
VLPDAGNLARRVADWLLAEAVAKQGTLAISLSGGSTPRLLYARLAKSPYLEQFPWPLVHWFWSDERFVPHDDARSNYRMVDQALLSRAPIPLGNINPILTENTGPHEAAASYERGLMSYYGTGRLDPTRPLFDVTLLGLGSDGHTASLFAGSAVLQEREKLVAAATGEMPEQRITLTYTALGSSRNAAFLIAGKDKRPMLERLPRSDDSLPASGVHPTGTLHISVTRTPQGCDPSKQAECGAPQQPNGTPLTRCQSEREAVVGFPSWKRPARQGAVFTSKTQPADGPFSGFRLEAEISVGATATRSSEDSTMSNLHKPRRELAESEQPRCE